MTEFATPASPPGLELSTLLGTLLIIDVHEVVKNVTTVFGIRDAIRATVTPVDGATAGSPYEDTLIFSKALVSQLRPNVDKKVLGRLTQGQAKPGQKPPWLLSEATPADQQTAGAFLADQAAGNLTADDI